MKPEELRKIVADDDLGLLKVKAAGDALIGADQRLIASFKEIEGFVREHGREPSAMQGDMREFKLNSRLAGIRASRSKMESLAPVDELGLLGKPVESVADAVADDDMGLLEPAADDIFTLRHVPAAIAKPDSIAQRKPCEDFEAFDPLFKRCHMELAAGAREARKFMNEQQITAGHFFIVHGVMIYVAEVGQKELKNGKTNARLRAIYENGTESNLLLRSLARELYKDPAGRRILDSHDKALEELEGVTADDQSRGFIYVLQSASDREDISCIRDLYKIGFSTTPVEDRLRNAAQEPTYLMAAVRLVAVFECYNLNTQKFESLLHTFFGRCCLEVQVADQQGRLHSPREWFIAPLEAIEMAIRLLVSGEIIHYSYDPDRREVVER